MQNVIHAEELDLGPRASAESETGHRACRAGSGHQGPRWYLDLPSGSLSFATAARPDSLSPFQTPTISTASFPSLAPVSRTPRVSCARHADAPSSSTRSTACPL